MSQLYPLFEHAAGYALFCLTEFEELSVLTQSVAESLHDVSKLRSLVQLVAFKPFKTSRDALDNMNSLSEGILHQDLQLFLETNLPKKKKKKQAVVLGLCDPKLAIAITEALGFQCQTNGVIPEVLRNIRQHFHHLVSGISEETSGKAQLALALNYSRAKVKFNINRVDNMIIQSISLLDQLDKDLNTFTMRIREWYSYHFPELIKVVPENALYAQVVAIVKDRNQMDEGVEEQLEEVLMDSEKVKMIMEVARTSMGMDISPIDLVNIKNFCAKVTSLVKYRQHLMEYLKDKMHNVAPNLACLIGETVGARLISHAGSLTNLAKYPASTVQILGAEKALFRAIKTRGNTPKYGLIFHSTFIGRAAKQNKGRISRYLANKCAIASRIDCFSEIQTDIFGKKLKQQVEDRLKFYDTGDLPPKNVDIMTEALMETAQLQEKLMRKKRKREKKLKKLEQEALENSVLESGEWNSVNKSDNEVSVLSVENNVEDVVDDVSPKKKKKKKKKNDSDAVSVPENYVAEENHIEAEEEVMSPVKKKKRHHSGMVEDTSLLAAEEADTSDLLPSPKKKKKKSKHQEPAE